MKQEQQKPKELQRIVRFSVLMIIILQLAIFVLIIGISGTKKQLDENAEKLLENTVSIRAINLEEILLKWSDFPDAITSMETYLTDLENSYNIAGQELIQNKKIRKDMLEESTDVLLNMLRNTNATGAFIVLNEGMDTDKKSALYLRDLNPENTPENNIDILVEAGGGESILKEGFTLDTEWTMELTLEEERDFYKKPLEAVEQFPGLETSEYGYFSTAFRLRKNDIEIITYTIPLIDREGTAYGVLGVEMYLDYLKGFLPSKEIGVDPEAAFLYGILEQDGSVKDSLVEGSHFHNQIIMNKVILKEMNDKFYKAEFAKNKKNVLAKVFPLHIYDTNTPFEQEQWVLVGLVHSEALYQSSNTLLFALCMAIIIALAISIVGAMVVTGILLNPIKLLMGSLKFCVGAKVSLPKTNITEIDALAKEIEFLNQASFREGSKVADILGISKLPLGVLEVEEGRETIFCTKQIFGMLGFSMEYWEDNHVKRVDFQNEYEKIKDKFIVEDKEDSVYCLKKEDGEIYIRFRSSKSEERDLYIIMDVTKEVKERQIISHDRDYDILTNLFNRRAFTREINIILDTKSCSKAVLAVLDLDNLKYINDTYGHDVGDQYIGILADVFIENQQEDILTGRISGDEFMIFSYTKDREENYRRIKQIHKEFLLRKLKLPDGGKASVSASVGTAECATDGITYEEMVKYADFAMYEAKNKEKGSIRVFSKDAYIRDYLLICGVGEMNRILQEEDIEYAFQPIFNIRTKSILAYEALMRPNSTILMRPDELLRVAASQSKLKQMEILTWQHALKAFTEKCNDKETKIFINSLADQCLAEETILDFEKEYKEWINRVVIELTEETKTNIKYENVKRECRNRWNAQIALDDYGSGYSNTDFLTSREWDYVKLDRTLIHNIHESTSRKKLLEGIIAYCHENNVGIIAEGVETREEFLEIKRLGCDYVQGYYLAKPAFELLEMTEALKDKLSQE